HLVVPSERIPVNAGVVIPSVARDGRSMFAVPWGPNTVLGTTDTEYSGSLDAPAVDSRDVAYVLAAVNWSLGLDVRAADVVSAWAGGRGARGGRSGRERGPSGARRACRGSAREPFGPWVARWRAGGRAGWGGARACRWGTRRAGSKETGGPWSRASAAGTRNS